MHVTTVVDGDKVHLNPNSVLAQHGLEKLILLDSSASTFYSLSFPVSQESTIKKLTGNTAADYVDGELGSAKFNKPKSFAVDYRGNIYVADKGNHAIRKITRSGTVISEVHVFRYMFSLPMLLTDKFVGVTTIAGGYIQKAGHADGPAKDATFSDDFELAFVPEQCALMISDHGNRLVRQINLKAEDCKQPSNNVLGSTSAWILGLAISCILGIVIGFVMRPFVIPQGGERLRLFSETWNHSLISLGRLPGMLCCDIKSAIVSSTFYSPLRNLLKFFLSYLALIFRIRVVEPRTYEKPVSLLDIDHLKNKTVSKSLIIADQLRELVSFDEVHPLSETTSNLAKKDESNVFHGTTGKIDNMIKANMIDFEVQATQTSLIQANIMDFSHQSTQVSVANHTEDKLGLIKRK
ncbi:hypothetical protein Leryth_002291 [Lithospermum erythrorhizon]|nr:hypothetical protein Leryth_002291 [Lithospermum erythrorhizon]